MVKKSIVLHILFWVLLMLSFAISEWNYRNTFFDAMVFELLYLPIRMLVVYVNWFILIPKLLYQNKNYQYVIFLLLLLTISAIFQRAFVLYYGYPKFFPEWVENQPIRVFIFTNIVQLILIIGTSVAITMGWKLFSDLKQKQEQAKMLEKEKTDSELKYLKSQINPHFLFNTLNTIYGLSLENSAKTPNLILKLSDFLSFSLYESNQKMIPLEKEIALMNDFIALEANRFEDRVKVKIEIQGNVLKSVFIPPLILVPFVENAFKHSLKNETEIATINIYLSANEDKVIFKVENSKPIESVSDNKKNGLGLINIQKRLDIVYGDKYKLNIFEDSSKYTIDLLILIK